jgi:hypothetical protein
VKRANRKTASYDPRRLQGVTVYQEVERSFSVGDRIQFTGRIVTNGLPIASSAQSKSFEPRNALDPTRFGPDSGNLNAKEPASRLRLRGHEPQRPGRTADRVLVNVDTRQVREKLLNSRFAYVSISRARYEAKIYTGNAQAIGVELSREVSKRAAIEHRKDLSETRREQSVQAQHQGIGLAL